MVAATVWAAAYVWYMKLGAQPLSTLWTVPLKRRRDARTRAAQEAAREVRQAEQRRAQIGKIDTEAARRNATDVEES